MTQDGYNYDDIYHKLFHIIYTQCLYSVNKDESAAETITNDVFIFLYNRWGVMEQNSSIRSLRVWLGRVAYYKCLEYFNSRKKTD